MGLPGQALDRGQSRTQFSAELPLPLRGAARMKLPGNCPAGQGDAARFAAGVSRSRRAAGIFFEQPHRRLGFFIAD